MNDLKAILDRLDAIYQQLKAVVGYMFLIAAAVIILCIRMCTFK